MFKDRIRSIEEEGSCDWCGCPQDCGDSAWFAGDGERAYCCKVHAVHGEAELDTRAKEVRETPWFQNGEVAR